MGVCTDILKNGELFIDILNFMFSEETWMVLNKIYI